MTRDRQFWVERFEPGWQRIDQRDVIMPRRGRHRQSHADFRAGFDSPRPILFAAHVIRVVNRFVRARDRKSVIRRFEFQILRRVIHPDAVIEPSPALFAERQILPRWLRRQVIHRNVELAAVGRASPKLLAAREGVPQPEPRDEIGRRLLVSLEITSQREQGEKASSLTRPARGGGNERSRTANSFLSLAALVIAGSRLSRFCVASSGNVDEGGAAIVGVGLGGAFFRPSLSRSRNSFSPSP